MRRRRRTGLEIRGRFESAHLPQRFFFFFLVVVVLIVVHPVVRFWPTRRRRGSLSSELICHFEIGEIEIEVVAEIVLFLVIGFLLAWGLMRRASCLVVVCSWRRRSGSSGSRGGSGGGWWWRFDVRARLLLADPGVVRVCRVRGLSVQGVDAFTKQSVAAWTWAPPTDRNLTDVAKRP